MADSPCMAGVYIGDTWKQAYIGPYTYTLICLNGQVRRSVYWNATVLENAEAFFIEDKMSHKNITRVDALLNFPLEIYYGNICSLCATGRIWYPLLTCAIYYCDGYQFIWYIVLIGNQKLASRFIHRIYFHLHFNYTAPTTKCIIKWHLIRLPSRKNTYNQFLFTRDMWIKE